MPFFFIVPAWGLCLVAGVALLFSTRLRFLASYVILCSTLGLLLSFLLSLALLVLTGKLLGGTKAAWIALLAYLSGIIAGGAMDILAGFLSARALNRRMGAI